MAASELPGGPSRSCHAASDTDEFAVRARSASGTAQAGGHGRRDGGGKPATLTRCARMVKINTVRASCGRAVARRNCTSHPEHARRAPWTTLWHGWPGTVHGHVTPAAFPMQRASAELFVSTRVRAVAMLVVEEPCHGGAPRSSGPRRCGRPVRRVWTETSRSWYRRWQDGHVYRTAAGYTRHPMSACMAFSAAACRPGCAHVSGSGSPRRRACGLEPSRPAAHVAAHDRRRTRVHLAGRR